MLHTALPEQPRHTTTTATTATTTTVHFVAYVFFLQEVHKICLLLGCTGCHVDKSTRHRWRTSASLGRFPYRSVLSRRQLRCSYLRRPLPWPLPWPNSWPLPWPHSSLRRTPCGERLPRWVMVIPRRLDACELLATGCRVGVHIEGPGPLACFRAFVWQMYGPLTNGLRVLRWHMDLGAIKVTPGGLPTANAPPLSCTPPFSRLPRCIASDDAVFELPPCSWSLVPYKPPPPAAALFSTPTFGNFPKKKLTR
jgi:hypothetical protein